MNAVLTRTYTRLDSAELFLLRNKIVACVDGFAKRHGLVVDTNLSTSGTEKTMVINISDKEVDAQAIIEGAREAVSR